MSFSDDRSDFNPDSNQGWSQFVPDTDPGYSSDTSYLVRVSEEVARQLDHLRQEKREGELLLTRRVSDVALDCARVLDGMEKELSGVEGARRQDFQARLEALRGHVYSQLAEALEQARSEPSHPANAAMN